ncbi:MAG TPA: single-stranded DNA-binding protein [Saprospiraceae bacterium]|nr:single-stranded DNA-binding protein [Saprospiraceae bacterium]
MKNNVQLIGYVGKDPELKNFNNNKQMVIFSLATSERFKSADGEFKSDTQWHYIVAWGKTAGYIHQNIKKGNEIAVTGKLRYNTFENKQGIKQTIAEVIVNDLVKITKDKEHHF